MKFLIMQYNNWRTNIMMKNEDNEKKSIEQLKIELAENGKKLILRHRLKLTRGQINRLLVRQWQITKQLIRDE